EQALRTGRQLERAGRIDDARIFREARQFDRFGTGRDDALVERDAFGLAVVALHFDDVRRDELAVARDAIDLALLGEHFQAAGELLDDARFPVAQLVQVDGGLAEGHAMRGHRARFVDDFRGVQQGLRGNTAYVEADATETLPAFDERDLQAEIGRA